MKILGALTTVAVCAIFVLLYALVLAQLVGRSFGISFLFSEDVISILFIWFVMGGSVVAYVTREHLEVDLLHASLAPKLSRLAQRLWTLVIRLAEAVFLGVFAYALYLMAQKTWGAHYGALPGFRYGYVYAGVLVTALVSLVVVLRHLMADLRDPSGK